jgi:2-keto-4-pentenoate hydratase/2-oxohepta-3-ene-1,7-dioic acid hydratase in catechol pathway
MRYGVGTYRSGGSDLRPALVLNDQVFDLGRCYQAVQGQPPSWLDENIDGALKRWDEVAGELDQLAQAASQCMSSGRLGDPISLEQLGLPFRPGRIFAAASNYVEHASEMGTVLATKAESKPYIFMKPDSSAVGPHEAVVAPPQCSQLDWEVELGVVIGRTCRHVSVRDAHKYIAGYVVVNDISARDLNVRSDFPFKFDWFQGKCFDTFAPLGPWLVPSSCIDDPMNLRLTMKINGEVMQDGKTNEMIFDPFEQISYLSNILTLRPGDTIATGTPTGVGMSRGVFLKDGDVMTANVESIGDLINPVVFETTAK